MIFGRRFPVKLKGTVYESYLRPSILYGSETWFLKVNLMAIFQKTEGSVDRAMCGVQLKDSKRYNDLKLVFDLNETVDRLAMANSVHWYGHVLRRENSHCSKEEMRPKRTWKKQVEEESVKFGLGREDALFRSKWSVGVSQIAAELR